MKILLTLALTMISLGLVVIFCELVVAMWRDTDLTY
jgi:hypothetical protein